MRLELIWAQRTILRPLWTVLGFSSFEMQEIFHIWNFQNFLCEIWNFVIENFDLFSEKNIKDVENESKSKSQPKPKRRNPTVRLAFHALIPNTDPSQPDLPLMVASNPISCSQPEGQPEILRMSSLLGNPEGGDEVFIIGKL